VLVRQEIIYTGKCIKRGTYMLVMWEHFVFQYLHFSNNFFAEFVSCKVYNPVLSAGRKVSHTAISVIAKMFSYNLLVT
jgi:hypothetical protein